MNVQPCPYCEYGNTIGAKFCNECGSPLHLRPCPSCQRVSDASATRCDFCGTPFAALPVVPANDDDPDVPTLPAPEPGTGAAAHDPETMESSLEATEHALQEFERRRASSGAERSTARESLFARIEADLARTMREAAGPSRDAARADARVGPARDATDRPAGRPGAGVGARAPGTLPDGTRPEPVPVLRETIPDLDDVLTELSAPIDGLDGPIPELDIPFDDPSAGGPAADATRRTPGAPSRPVVPAAADASAAPFGPRGPARDEARAPAERAPDAIGTDGAPPHAGDPPAPSTDASQAATDPIGTDPASRWKRFDEFAARLREGSAAAAGERPASEASGASLVGADAVPGPFAPAPGVDGEIRDESSRPTDDVDAAAGTRTGERADDPDAGTWTGKRADDPAAAADAPADAGVGRAPSEPPQDAFVPLGTRPDPEPEPASEHPETDPAASQVADIGPEGGAPVDVDAAAGPDETRVGRSPDDEPAGDGVDAHRVDAADTLVAPASDWIAHGAATSPVRPAARGATVERGFGAGLETEQAGAAPAAGLRPMVPLLVLMALAILAVIAWLSWPAGTPGGSRDDGRAPVVRPAEPVSPPTGAAPGPTPSDRGAATDASPPSSAPVTPSAGPTPPSGTAGTGEGGPRAAPGAAPGAAVPPAAAPPTPSVPSTAGSPSGTASPPSAASPSSPSAGAPAAARPAAGTSPTPARAAPTQPPDASAGTAPRRPADAAPARPCTPALSALGLCSEPSKD